MSAEAARAVVLIDALNVLRSQWPNLPANALVERCAAWARSQGKDAVVIFDGTAPGGLVGERELEPGCVVVGAGGESADDWIARRAGELAQQGREYWLVTSDRELRERAGGVAARVIGGGSFLRQLPDGSRRGSLED